MKFDATVTITVEAGTYIEASSKILEALSVFSSFSIEEGPDEVVEEEDEVAQDIPEDEEE